MNLLSKLALAICALSLVTASVSAQVASYPVWEQAFLPAARVGDDRAIDRLLRRKNGTHHALAHFRLLLEHQYRGQQEPSPQKKSLRESWARVHGSAGTLDKLERWISALFAEQWKTYVKTKTDLDRAYAQQIALEQEKSQDRSRYMNLVQVSMQIAEQFSGIGDGLRSAEAWAICATTWERMPDRTVDDDKERVFAIERVIANRKSWEYTFEDYSAWVNVLKSLASDVDVGEALAAKREAEGYDKNVRGAEAYLMPNPDETEIVADLHFEVMKKPTLDMSPQGGPIPMQWPNVEIKKEGPTKLEWFKQRDLFMVRPGANKFGVTFDGVMIDMKKNPFTIVKTANRIKAPAEFFLDEEQKMPYAAWFFVGGSQETFQGMIMNLEPDRDRANIHYKSAASWKATIADVEVRVFDHNSNGKILEEDPYEYGYQDRTIDGDPKTETRLPAFDGMQIGGARAVVHPYSQWAKIGDSWYHLREKDGKLGARVTNPEYFKTGKIKFDWDGPKKIKPVVLIVQGTDDFEAARFNIASGKPVEVPASEYTLEFGRITQGRGARMMTANIFRGRSEPVKVEAGKTATLTLGEPFKLDFFRDGRGEQIVVDAHRIRVFGLGGELYTHINGAAPTPEVLTARDDSGKGAKVIGEFVPIRPHQASQFANRSELKNLVGYFGAPKKPAPRGQPMGAVVAEAPEGYKIGLKQDKNKLFGKLLPIWK